MKETHSGIDLLRRPLVPLTFLVSRIFLTTGLENIRATAARLKENITIDGAFYDNPQTILEEYVDALEPYERFKKGQLKEPKRLVVDLEQNLLDPVAAMILEIKQEMIRRELEHINSALCGQYNCTICCRGPLQEEENSFFELPLEEEEIPLFDLPRIDTPPTRCTNAFGDPPPIINGQPFYLEPPALYKWRERWGLVLPRGFLCPNLDSSTGRCRTYEARPAVCRLPQIFPMVLEKVFDPDMVRQLAPGSCLEELTDKDHYYVTQEKILAVWDCPYVKEYKDDIIRYAEVSSLEPVFRSNKK